MTGVTVREDDDGDDDKVERMMKMMRSWVWKMVRMRTQGSGVTE